MNESEIDIFDLFRVILKKWKMVLALILAFAVAGGVYAALRPADTGELVISEEDKTVVEDIIKLEKQYTDGKARVSDILGDSSSAEMTEADYNFIASLNQISEIIESSKENFSDVQNAYYTNLLSGQNDSSAAQPRNYKKYAIFGAFGGAVIACAYICIVYCFSGKLRTENDLVSFFNLFILGKSEDRKKDDSGTVAESIAFAAENAGVKRLIVSAPDSKKAEGLLSEISENLKNEGMEIVLTGPRIGIAAIDIGEKDKTGAVVLGEIGVSRYEDISDSLSVCGQYGVRVLGAVSVR